MPLFGVLQERLSSLSSFSFWTTHPESLHACLLQWDVNTHSLKHAASFWYLVIVVWRRMCRVLTQCVDSDHAAPSFPCPPLLHSYSSNENPCPCFLFLSVTLGIGMKSCLCCKVCHVRFYDACFLLPIPIPIPGLAYWPIPIPMLLKTYFEHAATVSRNNVTLVGICHR